MSRDRELSPDEARALADAVARAEYHAAQLRRAYAWLRILTAPGREPRPAPRLLSDRALAARAREAQAERFERSTSPRVGPGALATTPAPVVLSMLDAQAAVVRALRRITADVAQHVPRRTPGYGFRWPARPQPSDVVDALDWLAGGDPAWMVSHTGVVVRRGAVAELRSVRVAERVAERLRTAADAARSAASITPDRVVPYPGGPCPACGRRSLQIDATLANPRYWWVECISQACVCLGAGCTCGLLYRDRVGGHRHAWRGDDIRRLEQAIARRRRRAPVRSEARGHGGWAERRTG